MSIRRVGAGIDPTSARPISLRGLAVRRLLCVSPRSPPMSPWSASIGREWESERTATENVRESGNPVLR